MFGGTALLEKIHIKNFLSLRDVELQFKPLTVLVGPNASGKSNVLSALNLLNRMTFYAVVSPVENLQDFLWAGESSHITFQLQAKIEKNPTEYRLALKPEAKNPLVSEKLTVKDVQVISIQEGEGVVQDENQQNRTNYKSDELALRSAGYYGDKPITTALAEFINGWEFYDFQPSWMRDYSDDLDETVFRESREHRQSPKLDDDGSTLAEVLSYWYIKNPKRFGSVSESLASCTNIRIDQHEINGDSRLCLLEGYNKPIPLRKASDGTLRLVAYYTLLNQPELPPLIAIEEPERNLHPGALNAIVDLLEQLAQRTQVIITTHSSQLLDAFNPENLTDSLGVLLLRNPLGHGTEVINLEDIRGDRAALDGWITDFGIGSAIFDSELLQDIMEEPA